MRQRMFATKYTFYACWDDNHLFKRKNIGENWVENWHVFGENNLIDHEYV